MRKSRKTTIKGAREGRVSVELYAPHLGYGGDTTKRQNLHSDGGCHGLNAKSPRRELGAPFLGLSIERKADRRKGEGSSSGVKWVEKSKRVEREFR